MFPRLLTITEFCECDFIVSVQGDKILFIILVIILPTRVDSIDHVTACVDAASFAVRQRIVTHTLAAHRYLHWVCTQKPSHPVLSLCCNPVTVHRYVV